MWDLASVAISLTNADKVLNSGIAVKLGLEKEDVVLRNTDPASCLGNHVYRPWVGGYEAGVGCTESVCHLPRSSILYAGEAPATTHPTRTAASMAIRYHIVFRLKRDNGLRYGFEMEAIRPPPPPPLCPRYTSSLAPRLRLSERLATLRLLNAEF